MFIFFFLSSSALFSSFPSLSLSFSTADSNLFSIHPFFPLSFISLTTSRVPQSSPSPATGPTPLHAYISLYSLTTLSASPFPLPFLPLISPSLSFLQPPTHVSFLVSSLPSFCCCLFHPPLSCPAFPVSSLSHPLFPTIASPIPPSSLSSIFFYCVPSTSILELVFFSLFFSFFVLSVHFSFVVIPLHSLHYCFLYLRSPHSPLLVCYTSLTAPPLSSSILLLPSPLFFTNKSLHLLPSISFPISPLFPYHFFISSRFSLSRSPRTLFLSLSPLPLRRHSRMLLAGGAFRDPSW